MRPSRDAIYFATYAFNRYYYCQSKAKREGKVSKISGHFRIARFMNTLEKQIYRFDDVVIDAERGTVTRNGEELPLRTKSFQVLLYLIENRSQDLEKDRIIRDVWRDTAVVDDVLVQSIKDIRRVLGDDPHRPRFIRTLPKHGYRFIGSPDPPATVPHGPEKRFASNFISRPVLLVSLMAIAMFLVVSVVGFQLLNRRASAGPNIELPYAPGKISLAVMFFENQSKDAELDWLREGLADMLITDLSRTERFSVLSRGQLSSLLERTGQDAAGKLGVDDALSIARQTNTSAVVTGSFAKLGDKVRLDVQLHDAKTGKLTASETITVEKADDILTQIDLLSLKLTSHLGSDGSSEKGSGLASVMTNNLEAYRYYSLGVEKADTLHNQDAIQMLQKAIAIDPAFAMAHARIGYAYAVTGNEPDKGKPYLEKAFQLSERLTEKDRLNIAAWYAMANHDYQSAIDQFRQIAAKYPLDTETYYRLSRLLRGEGQMEEAVNILEAGLAVDPNEKNLYNGLGGILSVLGRHDEAIAAHQRYVALAPNEPNAYDSLGGTYQWAGDYSSAIANYDQALRLNPDFEVAVIHLANTHFQIGQYQKALDLYRRYIDKAPSTSEAARGYGTIALVHLKKGDLPAAEKAAREVYKIKKEWAHILHIINAEKGGSTRASELEERFFADYMPFGRGGPNSRRLEFYYRGYFALKKGDSDTALRNFQQAVQNLPQPWDIDAYEDCLANAYLELGRPGEAAAEYQRILQLNPNYPLAAFHLGQAYELLGENDKARQSYLRFLESWQNADGDIPEITTAQKFLGEKNVAGL